MNMGQAFHHALDYFICDRCILEEIDFPVFLDNLLVRAYCPLWLLYDRLPKEEEREVKPLFPRSILARKKLERET